MGFELSDEKLALIDPLDEIRRRAAKRPDLNIAVDDTSAVFTPRESNGFGVQLQVDADEFIVHFEGWHEHFSDPGTALNCFAFGLSDECRLKITLRGGRPYLWTVQSLELGRWVDDSTTGYLRFPFWGKRSVQYRSNSALTRRRTSED